MLNGPIMSMSFALAFGPILYLSNFPHYFAILKRTWAVAHWPYPLINGSNVFLLIHWMHVVDGLNHVTVSGAYETNKLSLVRGQRGNKIFHLPVGTGRWRFYQNTGWTQGDAGDTAEDRMKRPVFAISRLQNEQLVHERMLEWALKNWFYKYSAAK